MRSCQKRRHSVTTSANAISESTAIKAIRVGRLLEEYKYGFFEEPVVFDWHEETREVASALSLPVALGEQEYSLHGFRWLIANDAVRIVQPDNYYFGGIIRSMQVARMAAAFGKTCTPHMSGGGLGYLYMLHFVSVLPNAAPFHEFKGLTTNVQFNCATSSLKVVNGSIRVPTGAGLGVDIDPVFVRRHQAVPRRNPREGGGPGRHHVMRLAWVPAFAGMTSGKIIAPPRAPLATQRSRHRHDTSCA